MEKETKVFRFVVVRYTGFVVVRYTGFVVVRYTGFVVVRYTRFVFSKTKKKLKDFQKLFQPTFTHFSKTFEKSSYNNRCYKQRSYYYHFNSIAFNLNLKITIS